MDNGQLRNPFGMILKRQNMSENKWNHFKIVPLLTQSLSTVNCQLSIRRSRQIPIYRTTRRYRAAQGRNDYTYPAHDLAARPAGQIPVCCSPGRLLIKKHPVNESPGEKTAPGIPRTVLLRAEVNQPGTDGLPTETGQARFGRNRRGRSADRPDPDRTFP